MISVAEAEQIIFAHKRDFGNETVPIRMAFGRVLAEDLIADRDLPPYDRVTMDGIAIGFGDWCSGTLHFPIAGIQPAGSAPTAWASGGRRCIEIMTGAAMPAGFDTVVRYEDIMIEDGVATIISGRPIKKGQNIHTRGSDKFAGAKLVAAGSCVTPAVAAVAASVGKTSLSVKRHPKIVMLTTGSELREIDEVPEPYEIRKSNNYMVAAALHGFGINIDEAHVSDEPDRIMATLQRCLAHYDAVLVSGGVSAGKFDFIPQSLQESGVACLFHKVAQRPGKPFWFGVTRGGTPVFAFPGNPVSAMMCLYRYFIPWLQLSLGRHMPSVYAVLASDFNFQPSLSYFLPVKLTTLPAGVLSATPVSGNGSGDFAHLSEADAFMELPADRTEFSRSEVYRIWSLTP